MVISSISVQGFKSIKNRIDLKLGGLTVLAGANSSGKSSIMQPLLLLKQTYDAPYDPGPLKISGPNVVFSNAEEMFWKRRASDKAEELVIGVYSNNDNEGVALTFAKAPGKSLPIQIQNCAWRINGTETSLTYQTDVSEIENSLSERARALISGDLEEEFQAKTVSKDILRHRSTLKVDLKIDLSPSRGIILPFFPDYPGEHLPFEYVMSNIIHVPGLRGNPQRTYPVTAVGHDFPGLFQEYLASIIVEWGNRKSSNLKKLGEDLSLLGLTWKVTAEKITDTQVQLRVGRLTKGKQGGGKDLVSVADVGFGVGQVLPVLAALIVARKGQLVYLEQPEIHLHPKAQVALAPIIARAVNRGVQVVVETHSELLLLGIQKIVAEGTLSSEKTILHWFRRNDLGVTEVNTASLNSAGAYGNWPVDFADTSLAAMDDYIDASWEQIRGQE